MKGSTLPKPGVPALGVSCGGMNKSCSGLLHVRAGIQAVKLEELERRLRNDVVHEALAWGGCAAPQRKFWHCRKWQYATEQHPQRKKHLISPSMRRRVLLHREVPRSQAYSPLTSPTAAAAAAAASDQAHGGGGAAAGADSEDVTRQQEDACVAAFWEPTGARPRTLNPKYLKP